MKKILAFLGSFSLITSGSSLAVSCYGDINYPWEVAVNNLKVKTKEITNINNGWRKLGNAISALNTQMESDHSKGVFVGDEQPTNDFQVLYVNAETFESRDELRIYYRVSDYEKGDHKNLVWGELQSFTQEVKINSFQISVIEDQKITLGETKVLNINLNVFEEDITLGMDDAEIIEVSNSSEQLFITGLKKGETPLTLNFGVDDKVTFNVQVVDRVIDWEQVEISDQVVEVNSQKEANLHLNNWSNKYTKLSFADKDLVTGELTETGFIIYGHVRGETTGFLHIDENRVVPFNVFVIPSSLIPEIFSISNQKINLGETKKITVRTKNLDPKLLIIQNEKPLTVKTTLNNGELTLFGSRDGTSEIVIFAHDVAPVKFTVTVYNQDKPEISKQSDYVAIVGGGLTRSLNVSNHILGTELKIKASNSLIDVRVVAQIHENGNGSIGIVANGQVGRTLVTLTYNRAENVTFWVTVVEIPEILPIENVAIALGEVTRLEVNFTTGPSFLIFKVELEVEGIVEVAKISTSSAKGNFEITALKVGEVNVTITTRYNTKPRTFKITVI
ncbi:hypothetical protein SCHIN_v1c00620 [Spiroplasma chinense]|uniref:Uncharacterized protein n=1 Tax=Spiroplasma chinense TaxID=216932 RepID=A0A5B9Y2L1_9MOLU|nr:lipoprotein [Spiroplasma chinense]QEH61260.1 hypothetical protein SCHIN_v1c00620 [Spiroplasma chinense]